MRRDKNFIKFYLKELCVLSVLCGYELTKLNTLTKNKSTKIHSQPVFHFMNKNSFVFFLIVLGLACENPFSTRKAELPDIQNPATFISPTDPETVFLNLQFAVRERNVENYILSFIDSTRSQRRFTFVPDQGTATANSGTFEHWSIENERLYLFQLLQATPSDSLHLNFREESRSETSETAVFIQNYEMVVEHSRTNIATEFRGQSKFFLERNETGDWAIYRWEDFSNSVDPSWSDLKAAFQ